MGEQLNMQRRVLLAEIARAYFLDGESKVEVASRFGISRFQVARLIDEARSAGIVSIEVHDPRLPRSDRESDLARHLGVQRVRIVDDLHDGLSTRERVGAAVLQQMAEAIRPGATVGVSWSRTLDAAARFLPVLPPSTVVQLTGASEMSGGGTFTQLLAQLDRHGVTTLPLYAPVVVDEAATARDLKRQPIVAAALQKADELDVAVIAIGAWKAGGSSLWDRVGPDSQVSIARAGVIAEIAGLFFDRQGRTVETTIDGRVIGVALEQLRVAKQTIGFSAGTDRAPAVAAAARTGMFHSLVLDADVASTLVVHLAATSSQFA